MNDEIVTLNKTSEGWEWIRTAPDGTVVDKMGGFDTAAEARTDAAESNPGVPAPKAPKEDTPQQGAGDPGLASGGPGAAAGQAGATGNTPTPSAGPPATGGGNSYGTGPGTGSP